MFKMYRYYSLLLCFVVFVSLNTQAQEQNPGQMEVVPNEYIVTLKDQRFPNVRGRRMAASVNASGESVSQVADRLMIAATGQGGTTLNKHSIKGNSTQSTHAAVKNKRRYVYQHALKGFSATLSPDAAERLKRHPEVLRVTPVIKGRFNAIQAPTPSWGLDRIDQADLPLDNGFEYAYSGNGVHLYVIDTGIRTSHEDFVGRIGLSTDVADGDSNPSDCHGHGTHVAGIAAGSSHGVAKDAIIHAVRTSNLCDSNVADIQLVLAGVDWVAANMEFPAVVNMSVSFFAGPIELDFRADFNMAVENLIAAGVTVVTSSGNAGGSSCVFTPSQIPDVITVAASNINDEPWVVQTGWPPVGTNYGACVDLYAPGEDIIAAAHTANNSYVIKSGTSMAAPHVAGAAAMYLESVPDALPAEVSDVIINSASMGRMTAPDVKYFPPNRLLNTELGVSHPPPGPPSPPLGDPHELAWMVPIINHLIF